mgnify:CR=1 FL=1
MFFDKFTAQLEAVLFAAGEPLTVQEIADTLKLDKSAVWAILGNLQDAYTRENRGLMVREVADGYQLTTKPEHYEIVSSLAKKKDIKLTNAGMETLAIIAFKQPVTRTEMEQIRGVKVDGVINTLLDLGLIMEAGRKKVLGNPILYTTTPLFLSTFGLNSIDDLPRPEELKKDPVEIQQVLDLEGAMTDEDEE